MNKTTKWLVGLVAALVVINVALVAIIWLKKEDANKSPQRRGDARDYLVKELQLNKAQEAAFDSLRREHFKRIEHYQRETRFAKDKLFTALGGAQQDSVREQIKETITRRIGELQTALDKETFDHFLLLRSLLNQQQQQKFDTTIQQVLRTMGPRDPQPGGPPPNGMPPPGERPDGLPLPPNGEPPPH